MSKFRNKVAIVTGGANGIGRQIAADLIEQGCKVAILDNNAGIPVRGYIEDIDCEWWDRFNDINMKAVFFLSQLAAENMRERGFGRIVNISSIRSLVVDEYHPGYNITKAGVNAITRNFAVRYAKWGITTNALALGIVITPMTAHYLDEPENLVKLKNNPMGRLFEMTEVSNVVSFLASDKASAVNGQIISVDGGGALNRAAHY